ncbi:MAG: hypothetical protein HC913_02200 [Microscillaceae bacterium]|nr:hypothetical protein [Microscillaceae bacterium]
MLGSFFFSLFSAIAQEVELLRMPTVDEIDALVDSLPEPAQVELKLGFSTTDLQDQPLLQAEAYLKKLPALEKRVRANPQDLLLQKLYYETASGAYAQDTARLNALTIFPKAFFRKLPRPKPSERRSTLPACYAPNGQWADTGSLYPR